MFHATMVSAFPGASGSRPFAAASRDDGGNRSAGGGLARFVAQQPCGDMLLRAPRRAAGLLRRAVGLRRFSGAAAPSAALLARARRVAPSAQPASAQHHRQRKGRILRRRPLTRAVAHLSAPMAVATM